MFLPLLSPGPAKGRAEASMELLSQVSPRTPQVSGRHVYTAGRKHERGGGMPGHLYWARLLDSKGTGTENPTATRLYWTSYCLCSLPCFSLHTSIIGNANCLFSPNGGCWFA